MTRLDDITNQLSDNHIDTIKTILKRYDKSLDNVVYVVADNCPTNPCIGNKLGKPFIGCYAHKLNLEVENYLTEHVLIQKVYAICIKVNSSANFEGKMENAQKDAIEDGKLEGEIKFRVPIMTRWSSKYEMIGKYIKLHSVLYHNREELELEDLILKKAEFKKVEDLFQTLKDFQDCTVEFQRSSLNLSEVHSVCSQLCQDYPEFAYRLDPAGWSPFETGVVNVLRGKKLTKAQKTSLEVFLEDDDEEEEPPSKKQKEENYAKYAIAEDKKPDKSEKYPNFSFINPTSVIVERFFSTTKYVYEDQRRSMTPAHLEMLLMLKLNTRYWTVEIIDKVVMKLDNQ
jgi:hypothetical protein